MLAFSADRGEARRLLGIFCLCLGLVLLLRCSDLRAEPRNPPPSRPPHALAQAGLYASLGGPASWGPSFAFDLLPGSIAGRWGLRGEWRGDKEVSEGTALVGLLYEAGAARPQLALKLLVQGGLSSEREPLLGAGFEWSLWALGPLGVSTLTDLNLIVDGANTRPALSINLCLHLGR